MTYLDGNEKNIQRLARAVFPSYRGRKFQLRATETVTLTGTYWDGGSRSEYGGVNLSTFRAANLPQFDPRFPYQPAYGTLLVGREGLQGFVGFTFDPEFGGPASAPKIDIRPGMAVVKHSISAGRDTGITFYIHPSDAPSLLPELAPPRGSWSCVAPMVWDYPESVTEDEQIVLALTAALKNSNGGQRNIRFTEAHRRYGITADRWTAAQEELKARKLLRKNGSITPAGRNVDTGDYRA